MIDWFEKIDSYYNSGFWSIDWVRNAVEKGKITAKEFEIITGEKP